MNTLKIKALLVGLILLVTGCVYPPPSGESGRVGSLGTIQWESQQYEYVKGRAGESKYVDDCSYHTRVPLVLDPSWDEGTAAMVREAARWWEDAVGVDLGELPYADEDCTVWNQIPGCIVKSDWRVANGEKRNRGIHIYTESVKWAGGGWALFKRVVAHEVGHYLGMPMHTESGVMSTDNASPWTGLQVEDIQLYEDVCVRGT